jgi:hypothetical protein
MGAARKHGGGIALVVVLLTIAGCSGGGRPAEPVVSTDLPTAAATSAAPADTASAAPRSHPRAVREATRTLRRYLALWARRGPGPAGRHLVLEQRSPMTSTRPDLVTWRIESVELVRWHDRTEFTLYVSLVLRFDGERYAWNQGENGRFVTVHGEPGRRSYHLELGTSP